MKTKKKLLHKKNSIYKGGAGNGMVFVVIIMLMMVAIAFALIGGQLPQLDNSKVGNPVVLVTSAPQNAKRNLQLYTFIGMTITPSPTPIPAANPTPTPQATPALTPSPIAIWCVWGCVASSWIFGSDDRDRRKCDSHTRKRN